MDVLRENGEYLAATVCMEKLVDHLREEILITATQYGEICTAGNNKQSYLKLLEVIGREGAPTDCVYSIWDYIKTNCPMVSANIPPIQLGLRLQIPFGGGSNAALTVSQYHGNLGVDIRRLTVSI